MNDELAKRAQQLIDNEFGSTVVQTGLVGDLLFYKFLGEDFCWDQVENLDLEVLPRITRYLDQGFAEALELARRGDPKAILHLERAILKDPDSEQALRAREILGD